MLEIMLMVKSKMVNTIHEYSIAYSYCRTGYYKPEVVSSELCVIYS